MSLVFIESDGVLLNVVSWGSDNRPAFVAHGGWVGNWELWLDPFQLLQDRWRCIGYDHRGSGVSTAPPEAIEPEALVDDLFAVLDHFQVERCVLAGESLGSLPCAAAVLRDPSRFAGLVIVDGVPSAGGEPTPIETGAAADFPGTVEWFVDACVPEADSEHIRRWGRQILLRAEAAAAVRILQAHREQGVAPDWSAIEVPTLVIHGADDRIVPVAAAEHLAASVPDSKLVVLPATGHVPTLTRPREVVAAIDEWWAAAGPAT